MKKRRLELHEKLCGVLGSSHVYFQPPESIRLIYPCIVYERSSGDERDADNLSYIFVDSYTVTHICKDPDTEFPEKMRGSFESVRWDRRFVSENLYHDVFTLYF